MNSKSYLVCDPARVFTDRAAWQAFRDIFDSCLEIGTEWKTRFGKVTVSHAHCCPKGKQSSPGFSITSNSGMVSMIYRTEGWTDDEARGVCGFACASRELAVKALSDMAFSL